MKTIEEDIMKLILAQYHELTFCVSFESLLPNIIPELRQKIDFSKEITFFDCHIAEVVEFRDHSSNFTFFNEKDYSA